MRIEWIASCREKLSEGGFVLFIRSSQQPAFVFFFFVNFFQYQMLLSLYPCAPVGYGTVPKRAVFRHQVGEGQAKKVTSQLEMR